MKDEKGQCPQPEKAVEFKQFKRTEIAEMRPVNQADIENFKNGNNIIAVFGENPIMVSISDADKNNGSPKIGDMIARNPKNHNDKWLIADKYFSDNFESLEKEAEPNAVQSDVTVLKISDSKVLNTKDCPLPLQVIPNQMGINLCSVDFISWEKQLDGQLIDLTITFIPDNTETKVFKIEVDGETYHVASILNKEETKEKFIKENNEESIDAIDEVPEKNWEYIKVTMDENDEKGNPLVFTVKEMVTKLTERFPIEIICSSVY